MYELFINATSVVFTTLISLIDIASAPASFNSFNNCNISYMSISLTSLSDNVTITPSPITSVFP